MLNPLAEDLDRVVSQTEDLWPELDGRQLFITGGTGFMGCWLLESFAWACDKLGLRTQALVLSRNPEACCSKLPHLANHRAISFLAGDVRSFKAPAQEFSYVIHAAAAASARINQENPLLMFDTVVQGTRHTLDFAMACGAKKLLFTSSGAVYGRQPHEMTHVNEDFQGAPNVMDPLAAYAEGKRAAEFLCTVYGKRHGLEAKIARCFTFVGPYLPLDIHYAVGNFIRDGLQGGPIVVKGDGTPYRSYLYAADLAIWLWTILFRGESCRPYNVGSDRDLTIKELAALVASTFDRPGDFRISRSPAPDKPPERYVPSVRRAKAELKLREHLDLPEALKLTVQYCRSKSIVDS